jgi:hypothetical protein
MHDLGSEYPDDMHYHAGYWPGNTQWVTRDELLKIYPDKPFDLDDLDEVSDIDLEEILALLERKFG